MNFLKNNKRIVYIVIAAILLGIGVYIFYIRKQAPQGEGAPVTVPSFPSGPVGESATSTITGAPEERLVRLTDFPVVSPSFNREENKVLYYKKDGGDLLVSDFNGKSQEKLSHITVINLLEAYWSPARDRAAVFYIDQDLLKSFISVGSSSISVLPQNIKGFSWSPDGKSVAYLLPKGDTLQLIIGDSLGKNTKTVFTTSIADAGIQWASADKIIVYTSPSGVAEGYVFVFSRSNGSFTKLTGPVYGAMMKFSSDGSRFILSSTDNNGKNSKLSVGDLTKSVFTYDIKRETLANKCVWVGIKNIYCAVPKNIDAGTTWPDDYLSGETNTSDTIELYAPDSRGVRTVFAEGDFDISDLLVTSDEKYLVFVNRIDGTLWSYKLK